MAKNGKTQAHDQTFALRCFIDGRRIKTNQLSPEQARGFHRTARHLCRYLRRAYKLKVKVIH